MNLGITLKVTPRNDCGNGGSFNISSGTVEAWIKTSGAGSSYRGIVVKENAYGLFLINNQLGVFNWANSTPTVVGSTLNDNAWHHVAFTFQSGVTNGSRLYIDGVATGSTFTYSINSQSSQLTIGNNGVNPQQFYGEIDEVRVWNTVRTPTQISTDRNTIISESTSGLMAYYRFDEGTSTLLNDLTTNNNSGTFANGTPNWGSTSSIAPISYFTYLWTPGGATTSSISATTSGSYTVNVTRIGAGCASTSAATTVTVTGGSSVGAASSTPTLCINNPLTPITHTTSGATGIGSATGLPNGVTAAWASNTITITGTPTTSGTFNYSIPLTGGSCPGIATGTITVSSGISAGAASSTPTLCINTALTAITHTTAGATGIGSATGLPTGVTAAWASNTITISGSPTATGTFNYSIPLTGSGCSANATGTITVTGNTAGAASSTPTICIYNSLTPITHATTGATGIGSATGLPTGVTAAWASNTITINGTPTATGTFNYSIPLTGGSCSVNATGTITVNPGPIVPTITAGGPTTFCSGGSVSLSTPAPANLNKAVNFNGSNQSIVLANPGINLTNKYTFECYFRTNNPYSHQTLVSKFDDDGDKRSFFINLNEYGNGQLTICHTSAGTWTNPLLWSSGFLPTAGQWYHIAVVFDGTLGSNHVKLYVNGTLYSQTSWPFVLLPQATNLYFGGYDGAGNGLNGGANSRFLNGQMDEIRFWNTARTASEISTNMNVNIAANSAGLVAFYKLNEGTGTSTVDATGLNANGTLTNGVGWPDVSTSPYSLANATTLSWTPGGSTLTNITASTTGSYTVAATAFGCTSTSAATTVTVTSSTASAASSTPALCVNTPLTAITHTTTGATGIGTATGLPTGVTAAWASNTITISGIPSASGTFNYSIPLTGGCGSVNATGTITVNPPPTAYTVTGGGSYCTGGSGLLIGLANSSSTASYQLQLNGNNIGTLVSGTGSAISFGNQTSAGTYTVSGAETTNSSFLSFDGNNDFVNAGTNSSVNITSSMTVEAWINPSTSLGASWNRIVHRNWPTGYFFGGKAGNTNALAVVLSGDLNACLSPDNTVVPGVWQHVAFVFDDIANTITIYHNGVVVGSSTWTSTITGGANQLNIGGDGTEGFPGGMRDVRIWNLARSQSQIQNFMNATLAGNESGLKAYFKFNEGSGSTANDYTSNGNTGTLTNMNIPSVWSPLTVPTACTSTMTGNVSITIDATTTVGAASSTPTLCINSPLTAITHTTTGATGIGTATGLPAGVTAAWASNTITISGTPTASGTFNYTIPLTGGCGTANATGTITVNSVTPSVSIAASPSGAITSGTSVTFTATPTNGGTPSYQWKKNGNNLGTNSATYTDAGLANNDVISCVMTSTASCPSPSTATSNAITMSVTSSGIKTWNGNTSTDWFTASNWTPSGAPTSTDDISIPSGAPNYPQINNLANCKNISLQAGATMVINNNLIVYGTTITTNNNVISGFGTFQIGDGITTLNATTSGGATFNNDRVLISAYASLKLSGSADINIGRTINVHSGGTVYSFGSNGATAYLHFKDDGINNGIIDYNAGIADGFILGQVISDRKIIASNTGYRYISSPVQNSLAQWADDFTITGQNGFNADGVAFTNPWPTLWMYNESFANPDMRYRWVSNTDVSNNFDRATGYAATISGNNMLDVTGPLWVQNGNPTGTISKAITKSGSTLSDGWNLMGNPYQAPLSFSNLQTANSSKIAYFAYYWVSNGTYSGNYGSYNAQSGVSQNGGTAFVAPHQGFMVKALLNGSNNISFNNSMTGNVTNYGFLKTEGPDKNMPLVRLAILENNRIVDETVVGSQNGAKANNETDEYDTEKFFNYDNNLAGIYVTESALANRKLAVSILPSLNNETLVPIGLTNSGAFTTHVTEMVNLPAGVNVYLEDKKLKSYVELHLGDALLLTRTETDEAEGRYFLRFGQMDEAVTSTESDMLGFSYLSNGSIHVKLLNAGNNRAQARVMDISGKLIGNFNLMNNNGTNDLGTVLLAPGVYLIEVKTDKGMFTNKVLVPTHD
jgi:hypothetical protein